MNKAKIFINGKSQAVRLPKKFRFDGNEVSITKLGRSLVLQPLFRTWKETFDELSGMQKTDFLEQREDLPLQNREYFE